MKAKTKYPPFVVFENGHWYVKVNFPTDERSPNGRRVYVQAKKRCDPETAERAEALVAEIRGERDGLNSNEPVTTLGDLIARVHDAKEDSIEPSTHAKSTGLARVHINSDPIAAMPYESVTALDVQAFYKRLKDKGVSPSLVYELYKVMTTVYRHAQNFWGFKTGNPMLGAKRPKIEKHEVAFLEFDEARTLSEACAARPEYFIFHFALVTGMRPAEYLALRWSDIDLDKRTIYVRRAVARLPHGRKVKEPKTDAGRRSIGISDKLVNGLRRHRKLQAASVKASPLREAFLREDLVFPSRTGTMLHIANVGGRQLKKLIEPLGFDITLYGLRHTSITLGLKSGDLNTMAARVGHTDPAFTLSRYGHATKHGQERVMEAIDDALYGEVSI